VSGSVPVRADMALITCVIHHRQGGLDLLRALHRRGIHATALWHARGSAIGDPLDRRGNAPSFEKDVLLAMVPADAAAETFAFLYDAAGIGEPGGGLLFQESLEAASDYVLPALPEEDSRSAPTSS